MSRPRQHVFSPNFNSDDGDLILRSTDGISFVVKRLPLAVVSDVFESMFKIPQPDQNEERPAGKEGFDVVDVEEKADVVLIALRSVGSILILQETLRCCRRF